MYDCIFSKLNYSHLRLMLKWMVVFVSILILKLKAISSELISLIPCKICGDKCSGKHYGVCSCEGCKSFFRRSLLKNVQYECQHKNFCRNKITRATRNKCQACRFQKCLEAGMGREGVKLGRMTKVAQESMSREVDAVLGECSGVEMPSSPTTSSDLTTPVSPANKVFIEGLSYLNEGEIEQNVIAAHMKTCNYTAEEISAMIVDHDPKYSKLNHSDSDKVSLFNSCTRKIGVVIKHIIEFAKDIRAFAEAKSRQIIFLKSATLEILVVRLSRVLDLRNNTVLFGDRFLPISIFTKLGCRFLLEKVFKVAYFLASVRLTEEELALLSCVLLINDHGYLQLEPRLTAFRESVLKALERHLNNSHPENSTVLLENIFCQIESIRCLHQSHVEFVEAAERQWIGVKVDPLYKETLLEDIIEELDAVDEMTPSPISPVIPNTRGGFVSICNENEVFCHQNESRLSPSSFTSTSSSGPISSPSFDDSNNRVHSSRISRPTSPCQDTALNDQLSSFSIGYHDPYLPDLGDVADLLPTPPVEVPPTSFSYLQVTPQSPTSPLGFTYF